MSWNYTAGWQDGSAAEAPRHLPLPPFFTLSPSTHRLSTASASVPSTNPRLEKPPTWA